MSFVCLRCRTASEDPVDIAEGFCPECRDYTGERAHPAQRKRFMREGGPVRAVWSIDQLQWAEEDAARGGHD